MCMCSEGRGTKRHFDVSLSALRSCCFRPEPVLSAVRALRTAASPESRILSWQPRRLPSAESWFPTSASLKSWMLSRNLEKASEDYSWRFLLSHELLRAFCCFLAQSACSGELGAGRPPLFSAAQMDWLLAAWRRLPCRNRRSGSSALAAHTIPQPDRRRRLLHAALVLALPYLTYGSEMTHFVLVTDEHQDAQTRPAPLLIRVPIW